MEQASGNRRGDTDRTSGYGTVKTTGQKVCIAAALVLLLCGAGAALMLSCCWHREVLLPVREAPPAPPFRERRTIVPVRLAEGAIRLVVSSHSVGRWRGIGGEELELPMRAGRWEVVASGKLLDIDGKAMPVASAHFMPEGGTFRLGRSTYRGSLLVEVDPKKGLLATELVELEDYLKGVVGTEMSRDWPLHALMAQAVAARTYVLHRLHDPGLSRSWLTRVDLAYKGIRAETSRTDRAVELSKGVVLNYNGALFPTYFHSTCGGAVSSAQTVFHEPTIPPLSGAECRWCKRSPHYSWRVSLSKAELAEKLSAWGIKAVNTIRLVQKDAAGRPAFVVINDAKKIRANDFRSAVGANVIKSTLFTVVRSGHEFQFTGRGWGHGVGMCQWGARGMAQAGESWQEILAHYYPGAEIASIKND